MLQFSAFNKNGLDTLGRGATAAHRTLNPLILVRIQAPRLKYFLNGLLLLEEESDLSLNQFRSTASLANGRPCAALAVFNLPG